MIRSRKASHFLNATEGTMTFLLIAAAIILILISGKLNTKDIANEVVEIESDFLTTQALRTFAQSPVLVGDEKMLVADALNEYFKIYINEAVSSERAVKQTKYLGPVETLARDAFGSFLKEDSAIFAHVYYQDKLLYIRPLFVGKADSDKALILSKDKLQSITLPAFFEAQYEQAGDYEIRLVFAEDFGSASDYVEAVWI